MTQPITTKAGTQKVDFLITSQIYHGRHLWHEPRDAEPFTSPHKKYHCPRVETHHHQSRYPKSRLFGYLPDLPRDLLHEPRGDDDAFLTDKSASMSLCPGTLYRRGPLAGQTAKVGSTIEDCPRVWPGTLA